MTNRLPTVGSDNNTWGTVLNSYLSVAHNANGTANYINILTPTTTNGNSYSSPYTISTESPVNINEIFLVNCTSGNVTITLPDATSSTFNTNLYSIKKTDSSSNHITINTTSSQTIDGSSSATISLQYLSIGLVSDGSNWSVI